MTEWLGTGGDRFSREQFPDGTLNGRQLNALFILHDRQYGRITGVHYTSQPVVKLTDSIVEVHLNIGVGARHCVLWLNERGDQVASAVALDDSGHRAESYWWKPNQDRFGGQPITRTHEYGMWSLGNHGAVVQTREFLREHYTDKPTTTEEQ